MLTSKPLEIRSSCPIRLLHASSTAIAGLMSPLVCTLISTVLNNGCGFLYPANLVLLSFNSCLQLIILIYVYTLTTLPRV